MTSSSVAPSLASSMQIYAVMCVRNEADLLELNLRYHLAAGIDHFLVVDNGSTDGTTELLGRLAGELPIDWTRRAGPFAQSELTTNLALEAWRRGADWVIPIDADEFWWSSERPLRDVLASSRAAALEVPLINFIQRREQATSCIHSLLTMTRRPTAPRGPIADIERLVASGEIGFVEIEYPTKFISRSSPALRIGQGNHSVEHPGGESGPATGVVCLHAPIRSRAQLDVKVDKDRDSTHLEEYLRLSWHVRRWRRLAADGMLDEEWAANSYENDHLDVRGLRRYTLFDPRLRDLVRPWIERKQNHLADPVPGMLMLNAGVTPGFVAETLELIRPIEGWMEEPEACLLMAASALALLERPDGAIVEIGSYCGRSTVAIARAAQTVTSNPRVVAIDPHEGLVGASDSDEGLHDTPPTLDRFLENIRRAGVSTIVEPVVDRSTRVQWTDPISMLFIDGLHDYESVLADYGHFAPWVTGGGTIVFDDYDPSFPGVVRFVDGLLSSGAIRCESQSGKLLVTRKQEGMHGG
ncbi:MAG TPA: class I SAM-dependent methyltransferase [Thermoanaerobaculia bacterium]